MCLRFRSAGTLPGTHVNRVSTAEKMRPLRRRSRWLLSTIDACMEAHEFMLSLHAQGIPCGQKRVARLMRELGISAQLPKHRTVTTHSEKGAPVAAHLLQQDFHADRPNQKWTTDTTYIWTKVGWLSLAVVLDLFSRMVGGWSMAAIQDATLVVQALQMAIARRCPQAELTSSLGSW